MADGCNVYFSLQILFIVFSYFSSCNPLFAFLSSFIGRMGLAKQRFLNIFHFAYVKGESLDENEIETFGSSF